MKTKTTLILKIVTFSSLLTFAGCLGLSSTIFHPLENGYGIMAYYHKSQLMEESTARSELQYQDHYGKTNVVWPSIIDAVVNDNVVVFIGALDSETGFKGNHLFAFQPSKPVVDITAQILELIAKEKGGQFLKSSPTAMVSTIKKDDQRIIIDVASTDWNIEVKLNWIQISDIMREVKEKGVVKKDRVWGASYIEKEFQPDEQKN